MTEAQIEKKVCNYAAKNYGWKNMKLSGSHDRGKPDRMFMRKGITVFVEFKSEGKMPSVLQNKWLGDLRELGFRCTWVDNVDDGKRFFDSMK